MTATGHAYDDQYAQGVAVRIRRFVEKKRRICEPDGQVKEEDARANVGLESSKRKSQAIE